MVEGNILYIYIYLCSAQHEKVSSHFLSWETIRLKSLQIQLIDAPHRRRAKRDWIDR